MSTTTTAHAHKRRRTLWLMTIVGFVVPNAMFGKFFLDNGFGKASWKKLGSEAVGTIPSAAILADAGLTAHTFITWASWDAHQHKVRGWWLVYPATYLVGICFGAPLYLLMREYKLGDAAPVTALPSAA